MPGSGTTPAQLFPIPIASDNPDVVDDMGGLAKAIEKRVVGVYATAADRNTKTTAAGVEEGMMALTKDDDKMWRYDGAAWVEFPPRAVKVGNGTTVPTAADPNYINGDVFFKV